MAAFDFEAFLLVWDIFGLFGPFVCLVAWPLDGCLAGKLVENTMTFLEQ